MIRQLSTAAADFATEFERLRHWSAETDAAIEGRVAEILADVQTRGDAAVLDYTNRFDRLSAGSVAALEITQAELQAALAAITPAQREALQAAAKRVRAFHERQRQDGWVEPMDGAHLGQLVRPLERVGIHAPGGKAPLPSTIIMAAVPARVNAGCFRSIGLKCGVSALETFWARTFWRVWCQCMRVFSIATRGRSDTATAGILRLTGKI